MENDDDLLVLRGERYWRQLRWSRDKKINARTAARHRQKGLAWLDWAGEIWIPEREGDAYIASLVKRPNPRPRRRQTAQAAHAV